MTDKAATAWRIELPAKGDLVFHRDQPVETGWLPWGDGFKLRPAALAALGRVQAHPPLAALMINGGTAEVSAATIALRQKLEQLLHATGPFARPAAPPLDGLPGRDLARAIPEAREARKPRRPWWGHLPGNKGSTAAPPALTVLKDPDRLLAALARYRRETEVPRACAGDTRLRGPVTALGRLELAGGAEVTLRFDPDGGLHLDFHERGPECAVMLQPVTDVVDPKPGAAQVVRAAPPLPDTRAPALRRLLLQARALQIACALRAHCHPMPPRVEIGSRHDCLPEESVTLALAASGWDLELPARLQELEALFDRKEVGPDFGTFFAAEGIRVTLQRRPATPDIQACRDIEAPLPREWRANPLPGLPRWTYSGEGGAPSTPAGAMPFALEPADAQRFQAAGWTASQAPVLAGLPATERERFLDWLAGPRDPRALPEPLVQRYLEGLEFRLLADPGAVTEITALAAEVARLAARTAPGSRIGQAAADLWDWLGATGARPLRPLLSEGPCSVLVQTGRSLALNGALSRTELRALAPQLLAAAERPADPDALADALSAGLPDPLRLRAPDAPLRLRYASLSGACDRAELPRLQDGKPVPDPRRSMRLLRLVRDCAQNAR